MSTFLAGTLSQKIKKAVKSIIKPVSAAVSATKKVPSANESRKVISDPKTSTDLISDASAKPSPELPEGKPNIMLIVAALAAAVGGYLYFKKK
jgi:hypothetical protein